MQVTCLTLSLLHYYLDRVNKMGRPSATHQLSNNWYIMKAKSHLSTFCCDWVEKTCYVNRKVTNLSNVFQKTSTCMCVYIYIYVLIFFLNLLFQLPYECRLTFSKPLGLETWPCKSYFVKHSWILHTTFHQCHISICIIAFNHLHCVLPGSYIPSSSSEPAL